MYDIVVIGAGPAGLCAALYARRFEKTVLVLEKDTFGGQVTFSPKIENYPGIAAMSGNEFADMLIDQVIAQGAEIELGRAVKINVNDDKTKTVVSDTGDEYVCRAVIMATGAKHRMLGVEGEKELCGHGISFCAVCDGAFFKGQDVAVIGGGNSALQEALLLCDNAKTVTLVQNLDTFTGEEKLLASLRAKDNVKFITGTVVDGFESESGELTGLRLKNNAGEISTLAVTGCFVAIGLVPDNGDFADVADLNKWGYFDSDETCLTRTEGVFCAGDCRSKTIRQITTATADGSSAAVAACKYIDSL